jgi:hypothetical protein
MKQHPGYPTDTNRFTLQRISESTQLSCGDSRMIRRSQRIFTSNGLSGIVKINNLACGILET